MKIFQIEDLPIESKMLTDALTEAQRKVEAYFFGESPPASEHAACPSRACIQASQAPCRRASVGGPVLSFPEAFCSSRAAGSFPALCWRGRRVRRGCVPADIRKQLWEYDQVLNTQRDKVYLDRRKALVSQDLSPLMIEYAERTVDDILEVGTPLLCIVYSLARKCHNDSIT